MRETELDSEKMALFEKTWQGDTGLKGVFTMVNNQPLGKRFMATAMVFFVLAGVLALLMRLQLAVPENDFLSPKTYNQFFTVHGSTMMFLFAVPFLEGLALYLLPLMLGSRDVAFPRLSAFSYWLYLFGGILFFVSFVTGEAPDAGWFAYTPLSGPRYAGLGMDFWLLGLSLVEVSGIATGIELAVTILKFRSRGMSIGRMPLFAWTILTVAIMIIFAFTVLLMATVLLESDRILGTKFFHPHFGGSSLLWQHLFWFFGHPEVYIMFLPATGIISSIVATFAGRPIKGHTLVVLAIVVTGFVSFGLWVHHMFATGLPELANAFFTGSSLIIATASGIQVFAWIATIWGQVRELRVPFLYVLGFLFNFVAGGVTGVMVAVVPFDLQAHDTFFVVAHFHYVLIGGVVFPVFGGLAYWLPKITGKNLDPRLGKMAFWLTFIGFNLTFFPMHFLGLQGMPRRVYTYPTQLGLGPLNLMATEGAFLLAFGTVVFFIDFLRSLIKGAAAGPNPWGAGSLEWSLPSPPPIYAFLTPPSDSQGEQGPPDRVELALTAGPSRWRATPVTHAVTGELEAIQRLPGSTWLPFLAALALFLSFVGLLLKLYLLSMGVFIIFAGLLVQWVWPSTTPELELDAVALEDATATSLRPVGDKSPVWWGTLGLVTVLFVALGSLYFSYFYLWLYSEHWPQNALPDPPVALFSCAIVLIILVALGLQWIKKRCEAGCHGHIFSVGSLCFALGVLALGLLIAEALRHPFSPTLNAYASIFHLVQWVLIAYTVTALGLLLGQLARLCTDKFILIPGQLLQFQITSMFWFFLALAGVATFAVLYLSPRLI